jgi:hypothetical protein
VFVFGINAAGAIKVAQGSVEDTEVGITTTAGAFKNAPRSRTCRTTSARSATRWSAPPSAPAGTFGSSSWTATGITTAFVNVNVLPDRPQIA